MCKSDFTVDKNNINININIKNTISSSTSNFSPLMLGLSTVKSSGVPVEVSTTLLTFEINVRILFCF